MLPLVVYLPLVVRWFYYVTKPLFVTKPLGPKESEVSSAKGAG